MKYKILKYLSFLCICTSFAGPVTAQENSVSAFNKYMSPAAGVDLFSGLVVRQEQITSIGGIGIAFNYSGNVEQIITGKQPKSAHRIVGRGLGLRS